MDRDRNTIPYNYVTDFGRFLGSALYQYRHENQSSVGAPMAFEIK